MRLDTLVVTKLALLVVVLVFQKKGKQNHTRENIKFYQVHYVTTIVVDTRLSWAI